MARGRWFDVSAKLSFQLGPTIFRSNIQPRILVPITEPLGSNFHYLNRKISFESHHLAEAYKSWLMQANHIFAHLQTTSHFEDYMCATRIIFTLRCVPNRSNTHDPEGHLFVCPPENFRAGDWLRWPDCPAYWILDSSGLSAEDARILGFPIIQYRNHDDGIIMGRCCEDTKNRYECDMKHIELRQEFGHYMG
ncbi:hypothetical protein DFH08DRAFT_867990 [Mycena albidolilacea]|uniref:Uncharacterized protein n=1 Tax=Mycena albidolilacea TaxID=1033008 RepID=A0AAD7ERG1_9AGAR|nr:hypothetical protein DFH08DRAFT_867990 [Mycena albidolilacea]